MLMNSNEFKKRAILKIFQELISIMHLIPFHCVMIYSRSHPEEDGFMWVCSPVFITSSQWNFLVIVASALCMWFIWLCIAAGIYEASWSLFGEDTNCVSEIVSVHLLLRSHLFFVRARWPWHEEQLSNQPLSGLYMLLNTDPLIIHHSVMSVTHNSWLQNFFRMCYSALLFCIFAAIW